MLPDGSVANALEWPVGVPEQADPDADPYELTVAEMDRGKFSLANVTPEFT